jgi:hypothetical protein
MRQILRAEKEDVNRISRTSTVARSKRQNSSVKVGTDHGCYDVEDDDDDSDDDDFMPGPEVVDIISDEESDGMDEVSISNKEVRNGKLFLVQILIPNSSWRLSSPQIPSLLLLPEIQANVD